MTLGRLLGSLALTGAALGCSDAPRGETLELLAFRQRGLASVALNEELLFHFSADLDRGSITSDSVRIVDEQGHDVAGERKVRGTALSFLPALACAPDLSDGGLRPKTSYRVVLGGFPRPDGIRSESGALLSATLLLSFRTAEIGGPDPLFLDPFVGPFPLVPRSFALDEGVLVLVCGEALDPSSVPTSRFGLVPSEPSAPDRIPLDARLIVNHRDHAELLLVPSATAGLPGGRLAPDDRYALTCDRNLRTLGGRTVEAGWTTQYSFIVSAPRYEIDFADSRRRSNDVPPGCAGTALWSGDAGLHVRYPAAAGDGEDGAVDLADHADVPDIQATVLTLAAGRERDLSALRGPVVLRSQTSIEIRGRLTRTGARKEREHDPLTLVLQQEEVLPEGERGALSAWLDGVLDPLAAWANQPWTVLIAGGDIRVPKGGAIDVEGPLVLVAGGWIRAEGTVRSKDDLWRTLPADGPYSHAHLGTLPLVLDPPRVNPLRTPLCVGLLTTPLPFKWARADGWSIQLVGSEGAGRMSAELLPVMDSGTPGAEKRALARLELGPGRGEAWDPPHLERLKIDAVPRRVRD